jgi:hypothetical protein
MNLSPKCSAAFFVFIAAALFASGPPLVTDSFALPVYESKSFENLYAAVSKVGQTNAILLLTGRHKISKNLIVPGNITLRFQEDALLFIERGNTVSIDSPIQAPISKIFEGDGMVRLKGSEAYPQWWGALGDGIQDDGYPIQSAIDSVHAGGGGVVRIPKGSYLLNHVSGPYYALKCKDRVSMIGEGNESILKIGDNLRKADRGVAVLYNHEEIISHCRYAHFTVDYNGKANLRPAKWGKDRRISDVSRLGAEIAYEITVENIYFKDVSGAHCVYFGNQPSNRNIVIRNCVISNVGQSISGNQLEDHSSIYIGGTNNLVSDNVFDNPLPCEISTAIEIHSTNTVVSNNSVTNYSTAVNIAAEANNLANVTLELNTFKSCRNGVVFWHYTSYALQNIIISKNVISMRQSDPKIYPPSMGIIYGGSYVNSYANMRGLRIADNTIFQDTIGIPIPSPNIALYLENVDDLTISGNYIYNISGEAVYLLARSPARGMTGVIISGNRIQNVGFTSNRDHQRAIALNSHPTSTGYITDIQVRNNQIIAGKNSPMQFGVTFNEGAFPRVDIADNSITGATQFEIINISVRSGGTFHIDHRGRGMPVNYLRGANGSRWVDLLTGKIYTYQGGHSGGLGNEGRWVLTE